MDCYTERAHLLALLTRKENAAIYTDPDGEEGFTNVLALNAGGRWLTWHIADTDLPLFANVMRLPYSLWDGHTTEQKYAHIRAFLKNPALSPRL